MSGPVASSSTFFFADIHPSTAVMPIPSIIRFSRESTHSIVSFTLLKNLSLTSFFHYYIGKEWSSVSKAAKDLVKKML
jgi:hypothetical protein